MKPIIPILILALALVTTLAGAQTNTPGEQFQSAVATFQQSATEDNARKLAELLKQLDPPPAIPDEAKLHALKGTAFVKQTKIETDPAAFAALYAKAAAEYQAASTAAPWVGDYYFNRASCEKSAGQFAAATAALKLDLIFARTEQDRDANLALRADIETTQEIAATRKLAADEKANSPAAKETAKAVRDEALLRSLDGVRFDAPTVVNKSKTKWETWYVINGHQLTERVRVSNPDPALQLPPSMAESSSVIPITGVHTIQTIENGSRTFEIYEDRIVIKRTWNGKTFEDICPRHKN